MGHSPAASNWDTQPDGGVAVSGRRNGEVLVKYSNADPLRRLMSYGFNVLEPLAFSLFLRFPYNGQPVVVHGGGGTLLVSTNNHRTLVEFSSGPC